jgi:hypothetical protein
MTAWPLKPDNPVPRADNEAAHTTLAPSTVSNGAAQRLSIDALANRQWPAWMQVCDQVVQALFGTPNVPLVPAVGCSLSEMRNEMHGQSLSHSSLERWWDPQIAATDPAFLGLDPDTREYKFLHQWSAISSYLHDLVFKVLIDHAEAGRIGIEARQHGVAFAHSRLLPRELVHEMRWEQIDPIKQQVTIDGVTYVRLRVVPIQSGAAVSKASAEAACLRWLLGLPKAERFPVTKPDAERQALARFKGLSRNGFQRAWAKAGEDRPEMLLPGRRSRLTAANQILPPR